MNPRMTQEQLATLREYARLLDAIHQANHAYLNTYRNLAKSTPEMATRCETPDELRNLMKLSMEEVHEAANDIVTAIARVREFMRETL